MIKNLLIGGALIFGIVGILVVTQHNDQTGTLENSTTPPSINAETTLETPTTVSEPNGNQGDVSPSAPTHGNTAISPSQPNPPVVAPVVPTVPSKAPYVATIYYDGSNFIPSTVTIPEGSTVLFENASDRELWVAANPHDTHSRYPIKKPSDCYGSSFDQCKSMKKGETWSFTFSEVGEWTYHNHMREVDEGSITVLTKEKYLKVQEENQ